MLNECLNCIKNTVGILYCMISVLIRVGNSTEEVLLETYSSLPITASGSIVIIEHGKLGTRRICNQGSCIVMAKCLPFSHAKKLSPRSQQHVEGRPVQDPKVYFQSQTAMQ